MSTPTHSSPPSLPSPLALLLLITIIWAGYFAIQMSGPPDLMDSDQERPAAYIMDAVVNGNWIVQRDIAGSITSKPPLYTWLAALTTIPFGRISEFTLYLPCALATLGVAWLLLAFGGRHFGRGTGFWAAATFLLTPSVLKQVALARTDPLFDFLCLASAILAFRAWSKGSGWFWYWLVAAAATLTKGPLGVALSAGGLLAVFFERKQPDRVPLRGSHLLGILVYLLLTAGWFALAYIVAGKDLIDKIIYGELVGQAVGNSGPPLLSFYKPPFYFLTRFAPWSILTLVGLWRVWKRPSPDPTARRLERFAACYFLLGLAIFSLASHTRPGLVIPLRRFSPDANSPPCFARTKTAATSRHSPRPRSSSSPERPTTTTTCIAKTRKSRKLWT